MDDEERPAKRQCCVSPNESTNMLNREGFDSAMRLVDPKIEKSDCSEQQDIQINDGIEDPRLSIPGLGNGIDGEDSGKATKNGDIEMMSHSSLPTTEMVKSETDPTQPKDSSSATFEHQTTDVLSLVESEHTIGSEMEYIQNSVNGGNTMGDHIMPESQAERPLSNVLDLDVASTSQDTQQALITRPSHDPELKPDEIHRVYIPGLQNQDEHCDDADDKVTSTEDDNNVPSVGLVLPGGQRPAITSIADEHDTQPRRAPEATGSEETQTDDQAANIITDLGLYEAPPAGGQNGGVVSTRTNGTGMANTNSHLDAIEASIGDEGAEWETDSSPLMSSSDSDSSMSSSEDDSDDDEDGDENGDGGYALLDPEEQARILMQDEGGSDDEGGGKKGGKGGAAQLRTLNEKPEEIIPKPNVIVTSEMKIEELGNVECVVEDTVVVKARTSGEYRVLETGSLLCLKDRTVVGVVAETLGRVQQPLYTIRFTDITAIENAGLSSAGESVYYVPEHSTFVFTNPLRSAKGTDASNFHDEEVGEDEMEFSDDEKEAEHKRQIKLQKQARKGPRLEARGPRRISNRSNVSSNGDTWNVHSADVEINYDDIDTANDGYTPLQRPSNYQEMMHGTPETLEDVPHPHVSPKAREQPIYHGRGRGGRADRGGRGRGRGDRGAHRKGGFPPRQHLGSSNMRPPPSYGHENPVHGPGNQSQWQPPPAQSHFAPSYPFLPNAPQLPQAPTLTPQHSSVPFSPSPISPLPTQSFGFPNASYFSQPPPQQLQNPQMPPPGSYINPAFFNVGQSDQAQLGGRPISYGNGNGLGNAESYKQVNDLLASLNATNRHGGQYRP